MHAVSILMNLYSTVMIGMIDNVFYFNGILQGLFGVTLLVKPNLIIPSNSIQEETSIRSVTTLFAVFMIAFSSNSISLNSQPHNIKQSVAFPWFAYHAYVAFVHYYKIWKYEGFGPRDCVLFLYHLVATVLFSPYFIN
eukprot:267559_1